MVTKKYSIDKISFYVFLTFIIFILGFHLNLFGSDSSEKQCYMNRINIADNVAYYNKKFKISSKIDFTYDKLFKSGYLVKQTSCEKGGSYEIIDNGGEDISIICSYHGKYKYYSLH